jgi:hypothetical protein
MNKDFRLAINFASHPKFIRLRRRLGDSAALGWVCLLAHVAAYRPDGSLSGMDDEEIAIAAQYPDNANKFVQALIEFHLIDEIEDKRSIHDWNEWNPWAAKAKQREEESRRGGQNAWAGISAQERSQRMRELRAQRTQKEESLRSDNGVCSVQPSLDTPLPTEYSTDSLLFSSSPKKEEIRTQESSNSSPPQKSAPAKNQASHRVKKPISEPLDEGSWLRKFIFDEQTAFSEPEAKQILNNRGWWADLYKAINGFDRAFLTAEFAAMSAWMRINSPPTFRGLLKFVLHWLDKAADKRRHQNKVVQLGEHKSARGRNYTSANDEDYPQPPPYDEVIAKIRREE